MSHACHGICTLTPLDAALTLRFAKMLRLSRKMTMEVSKVLRLPLKMQLIFWKACRSIAPVRQNDFRHFCRHVRMSGTASPATQNDIPVLTPSKRSGFAASHVYTPTVEENQRIETRHAGASKRAFRARLPEIFTLWASKSMFSYEFSHEPQNLLPQIRGFVRGIRQFSSHVTKCHPCHGIWT